MKNLIDKKIENKRDILPNSISDHGVTLISLIITIIILIILAGVVINLGLGQNGIFRRAKQAKEQYSLSEAREKLEMVLMEAIIEKETNENYNNVEFLDDMLERNNMQVNGDNVIVDNYIFTIDREKLAVTKSLGESEIKITSEVQEYLGKNENGKYEASLLLVMESNTNLKNIIIKNPDGTTFEMKTEEEKIVKDLIVEFDEEYTITVITNDGKEETRKIVEKSEEIIKTANELAEFRDNVNRSLTYEGKTIKLGNDIDLGSVCGENVNGEEISWEPIGNYVTDETHIFKGRFDGQEKTISNLYINASTDYQGLFGCNQGIIENINIANGKIDTSNQCIAMLVGNNIGTIRKVNIKNGNIIGYWYIGGIAGNNKLGAIELCTNETTISHIEEGDFNGWQTGGIVGYNEGTVSKCINKGSIRGTHGTGGICGENEGTVELSVNIGNVTGDLATEKFATGTNCGGIVGINGYYKTNSKVLNCYNIGQVKSLVKLSNCGGIISSGAGLRRRKLKCN